MNSQKLSFVAFICSGLFIVFAVGFMVRELKLFPYQIYVEAVKGYQKFRHQQTGKLPSYYYRLNQSFPEVAENAGQPYEGLNLVTKISTDNNLSAEIIDQQGEVVHQWDIDWFKMWPDAKHISEKYRPKEKPGTMIHGAVVMNNGDLVFNFEDMGLVRIDLEGEIVWRLPYRTHHSVHLHDDGNLWVSGHKNRSETNWRFNNTIVEVSPDGKILREWGVADILRNNGYTGLLHQGSDVSKGLRDRRDTLHLNDVEPFSSKLEPGFFTQGDVIVSLRNINTVFVFNTASEKIKYISIGQFVRQHDPDFIDGDTFSVFDNNHNTDLGKKRLQSKIVIVSAPQNTHKVYFEGTLPDKPFYTKRMGKHQWMPNGNLLITESESGRGFEVNKQGDMVWQYFNYIDDGVVGNVTEVTRLPIEYTNLFLNAELANPKASNN